ncbi:hypothetical protein [Brachybacterium sp. YJGR34]|uniref:hypothetical protein n=1 Tax=Brachybacterium sp. YJGR34 TaxID=2059911 RepID=UPI0013004C8F|nr:hypothetical protein [Brachybacterium sp. YJGR34]
MEMTVTADCGNSPRMRIVADLAAAWAAGEEEHVRPWLREDTRWILVGAADGQQPAPGGILPPPVPPEHGEILTVLSHGRLAACDGYLVSGQERVDFCHVLRFAGAARTAALREIRTYLQPAVS